MTALAVYYDRSSDLGLSAGDLAWNVLVALPFLFLGLRTWRSHVSPVALVIAMVVSAALVGLGYHAALTDDSSTAALAIIAAPLYAFAACAVILWIDAFVQRLRKRPNQAPL